MGAFVTLVAGAFLLASSSSAASSPGLTPADADVGNWTVGDCIMAQFAMELTLHLPGNGTNATSGGGPTPPPAPPKPQPVTLRVPRGAKADRDQSNCKLPDDRQSLTLSWSERSANGTGMLSRNLTIVFSKMNDSST